MFHKVMKFNLHKITFQNIQQTCCYCKKRSMKTDVVEFFQQNLDLSEDKIKMIFNRFPSFYNDSYSSLLDNYTQLMDLNISKEDIAENVQILIMHPITIKNYVMILEEGGFVKNNIDSKTLLNFTSISKKSVELLKAENYINDDINVQNHILSFINFPKELYPTNYSDLLSWNQIQNNVFKLYVNWRIKMDLENLEHAKTIYLRLSNKSFRLVERSIDIMMQQLDFSEERLRRHSYLLHSDPDNTLEILNRFKYLCGIETKIVLNKHPKIILSSWKTIEKIRNHFMEFGIPESTLAKVPEVYTLGSNTVYKRLCHIKETPELASFLNNPQVSRLVFFQKKVNSRLGYLQNKNCLSLNLLVTSNSSFNRFNCNGNDKGKTNDIMIYLTNTLGEDKRKLRMSLERHSYWQYISLLSIRQTYEFLKKQNFTKDQLFHCLQIILYPVHKIENSLMTIQDMKNVSYLRNSSGLIKREYILPLVLYNLEKNYHFSGNGVWSSSDEINKNSTPDSSKSTLEDTEELDHEPSMKLL